MVSDICVNERMEQPFVLSARQVILYWRQTTGARGGNAVGEAIAIQASSFVSEDVTTVVDLIEDRFVHESANLLMSESLIHASTRRRHPSLPSFRRASSDSLSPTTPSQHTFLASSDRSSMRTQSG